MFLLEINLKKSFPLIAGLLMITLVGYGQKKGGKAEPNDDQLINNKLYVMNRQCYDQALQYQDLAVATRSIYNMIALRPENTALKDTLAYLYYLRSNYVQTVLIGNEILESDPNKTAILEYVSIAQQNLGLIKEALSSFERLYSLTGNIYHQYNIASLQYTLKRYGECSNTLNQILTSDSAKKISISTQSGETQEVPIKAAAFNMRGVIALELNQPELAKQNFQKAVEIYPEFILAKSNLQKVSSTEDKK